MPEKKNKNWIFAVLLAVLFPALAVHVSCVAAMGPGTWGSGLEEKVPELHAPGESPAAQKYAEEFAQPAADSPAPNGSANPAVSGKIFWTDHLTGEDLSVHATFEGEAWIHDQRFYIEEGDTQRELDLDAAIRIDDANDEPLILERPTLMKRSAQTIIVIGCWRPWALSPLGKIERYLKSLADPTLRPELSLYLYELPAGPAEYWGPGHTLKPAPDRRKAVLLRSGALGAGYYSMHLWEFETNQLQTILSLRESDPGSGRSFDYNWSQDSRALHITGSTSGFDRRSGTPRSLDLIYLVEQDKLFDLGLRDEQ